MIEVTCRDCKGEGTQKRFGVDLTDALSYVLEDCQTCNGFGFLLAKELYVVGTWAKKEKSQN